MLKTAEATEYTLKELRQLKREWLLEAIDVGYIQACARIARELGTPESVPYFSTWTAYTWRHEEVEIMHYAGATHYLQDLRKFNRVETTVVKVDGRQVCYFRQTDDIEEEADNFFVLGEWTFKILPFDKTAKEKAALTGQELADRERKRLLDQLCIGIEV